MDAVEARINAMQPNEEVELLRVMIEKELIVRPDNLPVEYNELPVYECILMAKNKPERQMKPAEKAFVRSYIKSVKNYIKQQIKEEKKQK